MLSVGEKPPEFECHHVLFTVSGQAFERALPGGPPGGIAVAALHKLLPKGYPVAEVETDLVSNAVNVVLHSTKAVGRKPELTPLRPIGCFTTTGDVGGDPMGWRRSPELYVALHNAFCTATPKLKIDRSGGRPELVRADEE